MSKFESHELGRKSPFEQTMESPDGQEAVRRIRERRVGGFLEGVRGAESVEEAMRFAPDTSPSMLSRLMDAEGRKKAEEVAKATQEKWKPVLEAIRGAADDEAARKALGELEQSLGKGNFWEILEEIKKVREERGE